MMYTEEDLKAAVLSIKEGNECVSTAAKKYNIPVSLLTNSSADSNNYVAVESTFERSSQNGKLMNNEN